MQSDDTQRIYPVLYTYNSTSDGSNIITLIDNQLSLMTQKVGTLDPTSWVNGFINKLNCKAQITSLAEIPIPQFSNLDSDSDRLAKTLAMEWGNSTTPCPHFELHLHSRTATNQPWQDLPFLSLTHASGYPYRQYNLLDLLTDDIADRLAEGQALGFSIKPSIDPSTGQSSGLPQFGDSIVISGTWTQELNWIKSDASQIVVVQGGSVQNVTAHQDSYQYAVRATATTILNLNNARVSGTVTNNGGTNSTTITYTSLSTGNTVSLAPGGSTNIPAGYKGAVTAVSTTAGTTVTATETYNA